MAIEEIDLKHTFPSSESNHRRSYYTQGKVEEDYILKLEFQHLNIF